MYITDPCVRIHLIIWFRVVPHLKFSGHPDYSTVLIVKQTFSKMKTAVAKHQITVVQKF